MVCGFSVFDQFHELHFNLWGPSISFLSSIEDTSPQFWVLIFIFLFSRALIKSDSKDLILQKISISNKLFISTFYSSKNREQMYHGFHKNIKQHNCTESSNQISKL